MKSSAPPHMWSTRRRRCGSRRSGRLSYWRGIRAGKTEIAEYLRYLLRSKKMRGVTISGMPSSNWGGGQSPRTSEHTRWVGWRSIGPSEVDLEAGRRSGQAVNRAVNEVYVPSDCRQLESRCYLNVPLSLQGADVILVDLTYGMALNNASLKIFLESDYLTRLATLETRNLARDPDQDFTFIQRVLEIEHDIIGKMKEAADLIVTETEIVTVPKSGV